MGEEQRCAAASFVRAELGALDIFMKCIVEKKAVRSFFRIIDEGTENLCIRFTFHDRSEIEFEFRSLTIRVSWYFPGGEMAGGIMEFSIHGKQNQFWE